VRRLFYYGTGVNIEEIKRYKSLRLILSESVNIEFLQQIELINGKSERQSQSAIFDMLNFYGTCHYNRFYLPVNMQLILVALA
jgi:hypothetical protein